ncbi:Peroxin-3 [Lentinula novae-zelandiae]|nr:Peroxin-3 [Lentinula novae-zelandiae]
MISYLESHRKGFQKAAGIAGGLYLVRGYIHSRLEEAKEKIELERLAQDILLRRYEQTQEDVGYTVMALLSNLGEQILEEMDVEAVIGELQMMSNKSFLEGSESMSASVSSSISNSSALSTSGLQGWVDATGAQAHSPTGYSSSEETSSVTSGSFISNISTIESEPNSSSASVASLPSTSSDPTSSRSKAQLWNSVKLLTFTRTLTTIYSISLLTLLTLTQLTILARVKYVRAIKHMSSEEDQEAALEGELGMTNMLLMALKARFGIPQQPLLKTFLPSVHELLFAPADDEDMLENSLSNTTFETLSADYVTLSYYLVHIGWKNISTHIQSAVEEVLEGVSLKTRLSETDVHRLLKDMMQRVALEGLTASMLPNTEDMVRSVLVLGGRDDHDPYSPSQEAALSTSMDDLLLETRTLFSSYHFTEVLDTCVDWAVDSLMKSLEGEGRVFASGDAEAPRVRLASILPPLASWSRTSLLALPSELVDGILAKDETRTFSAWVWAKFELEV